MNIIVSNLNKSFKKKILADINFEVKSGEIFGILGPSGVGKTTLLNIITGQLEKDSGEISFFKTPIEIFRKEQRCKFGIVMNQLGLVDRITCYENLRIFSEIYGVDKNIIDAVLEVVGLSEAKNTTAGALSKGMSQKLLIARALLNNPQILFLDEPTGSLDPVSKDEIHKLLLQEKKRGKTIILTTHKIDEAVKLCDHVIILNKGIVMEFGSPMEILLKYNDKKTVHLENETIHSVVSNLEDCYKRILNNYRSE